MTYSESAKGVTISAARAKYEIEELHGMIDGFSEFQEEVGTSDEYSAREVLEWLGY